MDPQNTKSFGAGVRSGCLQDVSRLKWSGDAPRPVQWVTWYPIAPNELALSRPEAANKLGPVVIDAGLAGDLTKYPIVLLSHGTGGCAWDLAWLGLRLARAGYVAIGVSHHGNTSVEPYCPEGFLCWWERATDLTFALDQLSGTGMFAGRLDLGRVFGFGFSLGGYTVMSLLGAITKTELFRAWGAGGNHLAVGPKEFPDVAGHIEPLLRTSAVFRTSWESQKDSRKDERVRSAFLAAPAPPVRAFERDSLRAIAVPVEIVVGGGDEEAPPDSCAQWLCEQLSRCKLEVLPPEVGHYVFLAEADDAIKAKAPHLFVDPPGVRRDAIHSIVAERCIRMFGSI